jgi:hypothetical protein
MDKFFSKPFFMWPSIINMGILCLWLLFVTVFREFTFNLHSKFYGISK